MCSGVTVPAARSSGPLARDAARLAADRRRRGGPRPPGARGACSAGHTSRWRRGDPVAHQHLALVVRPPRRPVDRARRRSPGIIGPHRTVPAVRARRAATGASSVPGRVSLPRRRRPSSRTPRRRRTAPSEQQPGSPPCSTPSRPTWPRCSRASSSRSSWPSCACSPRATSSSRTCPASARPAWPRRWPRRSTARGSGSSSPPTCCRPTSSGSASTSAATSQFRFQPGPLFANIVLADEINRASPKTQSALLEAMEERQITVDGVSHVLAPPFMVIATQNPVDQEGTYRLPESQLDRFMLRISLGYPSREAEISILDSRGVERVAAQAGRRRVGRRGHVDDRRGAVGVRRRRVEGLPRRSRRSPAVATPPSSSACRRAPRCNSPPPPAPTPQRAAAPSPRPTT